MDAGPGPRARVPDVVVRVRDGRLVEDGPWVYVWLSGRDGRVVHVGATPLPPVVRTWLHLNDERPHVGHVAAAYDAAPGEALDVLAFRVDGDRAVVRRALAQALGEAGLLSAAYAGPVPAPASGDPDVAVADLVEAVRRHRVG